MVTKQKASGTQNKKGFKTVLELRYISAGRVLA